MSWDENVLAMVKCSPNIWDLAATILVMSFGAIVCTVISTVLAFLLKHLSDQSQAVPLNVGDVIDIMAKPPMGIWTGMLNGRIGHFKFIYVDEITEESSDKHKETHIHRVRQKSTVQEVLEHLSMEEHFSFLQPNDYQIAEDLMRMREHYLTEPNVTDPEHRHHLLTTVESLQQLRCSSQLESESNQESMTPSENIKTDMNNCPQDSGRHMPCDSPTNSTEDTHLQFISEYPVP